MGIMLRMESCDNCDKEITQGEHKRNKGLCDNCVEAIQ